MYYGNIKKNDIANGLGVRVSLFVSGCRNKCKNCFNKETWDFCYGQPFTEETENEIFKELDKYWIEGLSVLGGEPFEPENQKDLLPFLKKVKQKYPQKDIWVYSGYLLDEQMLKPSKIHTEYTDEILSLIDVLVDGRFVEELHDVTLKFRGSSNQRVIDLKETIKSGKIILYMD